LAVVLVAKRHFFGCVFGYAEFSKEKLTLNEIAPDIGNKKVPFRIREMHQTL